jgi:hypothetical protein
MPTVDKSIDTQKIIEGGLKEEEHKNEYFYNQKKRGKFDASKGTEAEQWQAIFGKNPAAWDEEAYKLKKEKHDEEMKNKFGD